MVHPADAPLRTSEGASASGITDLAARRIDCVRAFHPHELVHAAAGRLGLPPAFFAEGLAVALSSGGRWHGRDVDAVARGALAAGARLEPLFERFGDDPDLDYALAGCFVAFLLDIHGIETMVGFLKWCSSPSLSFERSFSAAHGRTVANASLAWRAHVLAQGRSGWGWSDASTWPRSLQRSRSTHTATASLTSYRTPAETGASVLMSPTGTKASRPAR